MLPAPRVLNPLPPTVTPPPASPLAWNSGAFGYNAYGGSIALGPFKMWLSTPFGMTSLFTDPLSANFVEAGSFANGFWYGARYSTNALVKIDTTTGVLTTVATITGATSITGLAWDATTNTMYASDYGTSNKLGTLNLTTGVFTPLSGVVGTGLLIDIACSNNGTIYGHMITAPTTPSQIYTINKTTGVGTALPQTTGFNANYAQGMSWDHSVDTGYLSAYNYSTSTGELRKINAATGSTTLIGAIVSEVDGFAIPGGGTTPTSLVQAHQFCSNYPALPGTGALLYHASCVLGDTLYVAGGDGTGLPSTTFYKYAISSNTWTTGVSMPGAKCGGDLCAANGKIFYIGGGSASNTVGTAEQYKYTPSTGSWTTITPIPTPTTGNVAETYNDTIIYCMMGGWSTYLTTIQVYYVNSNTWTTATAFGGPGRRSFAGGILGNNIFVACGYNGTYLSSFYKGVINPANPLTITWTSMTNNIQWTASRAGGTAIAGKFYVCPGDTGTGVASSMIGVFDTTAGTWSYVGGDPFVNSNYWGIMSASIVHNGVKIWRPAGSLAATTRPLVVFADTCFIYITGISNNNNSIPNNYILKQNYPNPFNPVTKISFDIPKTGLVTLKVYDVLGKEIATIVNEVKNAGSYLVDFNGTSLSSGVYFYKLESNGFTAVKKMMLIK